MAARNPKTCGLNFPKVPAASVDNYCLRSICYGRRGGKATKGRYLYTAHLHQKHLAASCGFQHLSNAKIGARAMTMWAHMVAGSDSIARKTMASAPLR